MLGRTRIVYQNVEPTPFGRRRHQFATIVIDRNVGLHDLNLGVCRAAEIGGLFRLPRACPVIHDHSRAAAGERNCRRRSKPVTSAHIPSNGLMPASPVLP